MSLAIILGACAADTSKPAPQAEAKPTEPAIPEEIQSAAQATNNIPGTIVTRVVIAENSDGKWAEILRCDEHLKNQKGFLGLTPLAPITGWRLQYEQSDEKGLELYFTPLKGATDSHVLPIGVRWNKQTKRYQSLDRTYEHFLLENPTIQDARSSLR